MTTQTETMVVAWSLQEKHEDTSGVDLIFYRAEWWTGDDESNFQDVAPGTPGAGTLADKGAGVMTLRLDREKADRFDVGRQYAFTSDVQPVYEGE